MAELYLPRNPQEMTTAPDTPETTCCTVSNIDTFRVESRDVYGNFLIANTPLLKGEIVFSNAPFSWLLRGDYSGSRCGTCFKTPKSSNLLLCSKCKSIQYCSASCQRADWPQHKSECSKMSDIRSLKMPSSSVDEVLLLNRTLVVQKKTTQQRCGKRIHPYLGRSITSCGSDHLSSMSVGGGDRTDDMVAACRIFGHTMPAVAQLMAQFRSNNFGVLSDLMGCIGVGVYPQAALLNHSCAPTCLLTYTLTQDGPIANVSNSRHHLLMASSYHFYCKYFILSLVFFYHVTVYQIELSHLNWISTLSFVHRLLLFVIFSLERN